MAFQFRRGTDAERQGITPRSGEPLYVTDTGKVYVGDGTTQGGILLSGEVAADDSPQLGGNLDLNNNDIVGTGNINIDGFITATGNINLGDGAEDNIIVGGVIESSLIPGEDGTYDLGDSNARWRQGWFEGINVDGEIRSNSIAVDKLITSDSVLFYDIDTNEVNADLRGSVYAQDSGIIVDSQTGDISATDITAELVFSDLQGAVFANNGEVIVDSVNKNIFSENLFADNLTIAPETGQAQVNQTSIGEEPSSISLTRQSATNLEGSVDAFGRVLFNRIDDVNGTVGAASISASDVLLALGVSDNGDFSDPSRFYSWTGEYFGIGKLDPNVELDVNGSASISGEVTASALKGTIVGDDSTIIIDAVNNTITSGGFIQFGSYTDSSRPTGVNGMVIYNTTVNRFQGYQNNAWINLDDGSLA